MTESIGRESKTSQHKPLKEAPPTTPTSSKRIQHFAKETKLFFFPQPDPVVVQKAKSIYHKLGTEFSAQELEGSSHATQFLHLLKDINTFSLDKSTYANLKSGELDLKEAQSILHALETLNKSEPFFNQISEIQAGFTSSSHKTRPHSPSLMAQKKNNLKETIDLTLRSLNEGSSIIFPGGTSNHGVIYEIKKEKNNYSFKIINTGAGADRHHELKQSEESLKIQSIIYKDIPLENLGPSFWEPLITSISGESAVSSMEPIYAHLEKSLSNEEKTNKVGGTWYKAQRTGICAYKSLSVWVHDELVPDKKDVQAAYTFEQFKLFRLNQDKRSLDEDAKVRSYLKHKVTTPKNSRAFYEKMFSSLKKIFSFKSIPKEKKLKHMDGLEIIEHELNKKIAHVEEKIAKHKESKNNVVDNSEKI